MTIDIGKEIPEVAFASSNDGRASLQFDERVPDLIIQAGVSLSEPVFVLGDDFGHVGIAGNVLVYRQGPPVDRLDVEAASRNATGNVQIYAAKVTPVGSHL